MSVLHFLRVLFAIGLSGAVGWCALLAFNVIKVMQRLEAFQATAPDEDFGVLPSVVGDAMRDMQGGSVLFLAAAIAGVALSEIVKTRSLVYYAGATGALAAAFAAALAHPGHPLGSGPVPVSLAVAGFVAGFTYWVLAGQSAGRNARNIKAPTTR